MELPSEQTLFKTMFHKPTKIKKPKGLFLIGCDCGYPLFVRQSATDFDLEQAEDRQLIRQMMQEQSAARYDAECIEKAHFVWTTSVRWSEDWRSIIGACKECGRGFWLKWEIEFFNEDETPKPHFDIHDPYDGGLMAVISSAAPHIRYDNVWNAERNSPTIEQVKLPSPSGPQWMYPMTKEKKRFAQAVQRAINLGLSAEGLPNWYKQAGPKQFEEWRREIDNLVKTKGLMPF